MMRIIEVILSVLISFQGQLKHFLSGEEIINNLIYFQQGEITVAIEIKTCVLFI